MIQVEQTYRTLRASGYRAHDAFMSARHEAELQRAEEDGMIRFYWLPDSDPMENYDRMNAETAKTSAERHQYERLAEETDRAIEAGYLTNNICRAYVSAPCNVRVSHWCESEWNEMDEEPQSNYIQGDTEHSRWVAADALCGVQLAWGTAEEQRQTRQYTRSIERDMALELGIIGREA